MTHDRTKLSFSESICATSRSLVIDTSFPIEFRTLRMQRKRRIKQNSFIERYSYDAQDKLSIDSLTHNVHNIESQWNEVKSKIKHSLGAIKFARSSNNLIIRPFNSMIEGSISTEQADDSCFDISESTPINKVKKFKVHKARTVTKEPRKYLVPLTQIYLETTDSTTPGIYISVSPRTIHDTSLEKKAESLMSNCLSNNGQSTLKSYSSSTLQRMSTMTKVNSTQDSVNLGSSMLSIKPPKMRKSVNNVTKWNANTLEVETRNKKLRINKSSGERVRTYI